MYIYKQTLFLESVDVCFNAELPAGSEQTIASSSALQNSPNNVCTLMLTNVPINSVVQLTAFSSVPLSSSSFCPRRNCSYIKIAIPDNLMASYVSTVNSPIYSRTQYNSPIRVAFKSTTPGIGEQFNLTVKGRLSYVITRW